ncbi:PAPA-1-like conserved region-domain-containing protein [Calycina marina]|uniref:PAPA-1-like conserved region-domain-containing protein n=1 Tax=Calycina marina TaxID=1763456 RepID=A0A9P7ZBZ1_9HELO|nr:PAPA-1-like conserved region-domain-containing protein [Calycina marina]
MATKSERPGKKIRKLSTDSEGAEEVALGYDWADGARQTGSAEAKPRKAEVARPRRNVSDNIAIATVQRGPPTEKSNSPESMRLTVKTSSNKLREATRAPILPGTAIAISSRETLDGGEILEGKRARNVKKSYVLPESDDEDEEMEDVEDEDVEGESEEEEDEMDDDGLGEEDADGDIDLNAPPPPPVIKITKARPGAITTTVKPPTNVDHKTVVQKEMEAVSDDEELSDLDSVEEVDEEGELQDAEGEDDDIELGDSDDGTPGMGSRKSTPDLGKLTKRQRARFDEGGENELMALPDEVQVKKHFTAEEVAMRRTEMARRRKNLSEKRNEEEKMETINKLLKKQAPKTNARRSGFNPTAANGSPELEQKPDALFVRHFSNKYGNYIGVPEEWMDSPIGAVFQGGVKQAPKGTGGRLIEEFA